MTRDTLASIATLHSADVALALHETALRNHNLGEGPLRAICESAESHLPRAEAILATLATRKLADEGLAGEPTTEAGRRLAEAIASLDERLPIDPGDAILAIEAEAATPPALRCDYDCDACRAQPEDEEYPDTLRETLRMALPRAINFRFLPPRIVSDAIWGEVADELVAARDAAVKEMP